MLDAPEIYQRYLHEVFDDLDGVEIILGDISVYGSSEGHDERLESP